MGANWLASHERDKMLPVFWEERVLARLGRANLYLKGDQPAWPSKEGSNVPTLPRSASHMKHLRIFIAFASDSEPQRRIIRTICESDKSIKAICRKLGVSLDWFDFTRCFFRRWPSTVFNQPSSRKIEARLVRVSLLAETRQ